MRRARTAQALLTAMAVVATWVLAPTPAGAAHAWETYHWPRSTNPLELEIGDNMSSTWATHLGVAVADWNASSVLDLTLAQGQAKGRCKATTGRIEVCNDTYGNTGWLGVASISLSGDHITAATAKMNDTYFSSPPYNTAAWRQMVVCHEVGHGFGLGHQDEDHNNANLGSCMDYTNDPSTNQHPDSHDYAELEAIYAHLDSGGGSGGNGGGGGNGGCPPRKPGCGSRVDGGSAPSDWGQLVRSEGREATYVKHLGHGQRVITFVIWA